MRLSRPNFRARWGLEDADELALGRAAVTVFLHVDDRENDGCGGDDAEERKKNEHEGAFQNGRSRLTEAPLLVSASPLRHSSNVALDPATAVWDEFRNHATGEAQRIPRPA